MTARAASRRPRAWRRRRVRAGDWTITALLDGWFRLDGGAMWGVVPKVLWERMTPPDEDNTILLALRPFLAERGEERVLIEVGIGERWNDKERRIFRMDRADDLVTCLAACGVTPADVTHVVATHCHWDHIGAQVVEADGELVPLFPGARHFAPRVEVEAAKHPGAVRRASYRAEDVEVLERHGLLETWDGDAELLPGLWAHHLGGHSDGVSLVTLNEDGPGECAVFWSDVVPTTHHLQPHYVMAFDIDVARSFEERSRWIACAADAGWIGLFYHDPDEPFGRIVRSGERYAFETVAGEALEPAD